MALTPSQRIKRITEIAKALEPENWLLIDLSLQQFGFPTEDRWEGQKDGYIIYMLKDGRDEALVDLGEHLGIRLEETKPPGRIDPPFWRKGMLRVFVSHLATQRGVAANLQQACLRFGISCFVAHNDIEPTAEWQREIETALATCEGMVALLHRGFHASNWTDQEVGYAMGRGVPVFTVCAGQDPYGFIGRFQAFQGTDKSSPRLARELFDAYRRNRQTQRRMSEVVVGLFEQSNSFAEATARVGYLEDLEHWEPSYAARLRSALRANNQISRAWGVPDRLNALMSKWDK
jgi:hypothetical protein